jgi:HlyD family secretion protein
MAAPDVTRPDQTPRQAIARLNRLGLVLALVLVGGFGSWATFSELSGAVIASGSIVVESNVKKVQHSAGGIVGQILVREGDKVEAGQVLMRLDDTVTRATLGMVRSQLDELLSRQARLIAERDGGESLVFPDELVARAGEKAVKQSMIDEVKLFENRGSARAGHRAQLRERIAQSEEEISGLKAQIAAKELEIKFITTELEGLRDLWARKLVPISRVMLLERDRARLDGERGHYLAETARARGKISETALQIIQLDQDFRTEVLKELRDVQGRIAELRERLTAAEDQLRRIDIRAPQAGVVHSLAVHTVGGVIGTGETIMLIVPQSDALVVEAKVAPQDIDQVSEGSQALIRVMAGNQRTSPDISGVLTRVSADLTKDSQSGQMPGMSYYVVRIGLSDIDVKKLGDFRLLPGMPIEAFIQTDARSPLGYLFKPLREQIARTFRER